MTDYIAPWLAIPAVVLTWAALGLLFARNWRDADRLDALEADVIAAAGHASEAVTFKTAGAWNLQPGHATWSTRDDAGVTVKYADNGDDIVLSLDDTGRVLSPASAAAIARDLQHAATFAMTGAARRG